MSYGIIYELTCLPTGLCYIGQTVMSLEARWRGHVQGALGARLDWAISKAIREHGPDSFQKKILCECESKDELNQAERAFITERGSVWPGGYNMTNGGEGPCELTRRKIGDALRGRPLSEEHRAAISRAHTGQKRSEEARQAMSEAQRRYFQEHPKETSPEQLEKMRAAWVGRKHTDETRRIMSEKRRAYVPTPEHRKRISAAASRSLRGHIVTQETREKLQRACRALTPEQDEQVLAAVQAGETLKSIAARFGVGITTVCRARDRALDKQHEAATA